MRIGLTGCVVALAGAALLALGGCGGVGEPPPAGPEALYAVEGLPSSSLTASAINPDTGALVSPAPSVIQTSCVGGAAGVAGQFLFVSSCGGQIFGYSIDPTSGAATPLAGSPFSLPSGSSPFGLAAPPNGYFLYATDAGQIDGFAVDRGTGNITPIPGSPFPSGTGPQLVVDPSGAFFYATDDDAPGGIMAFAIGPSGALSPVPGSPFAIPGQPASNSWPYGIVDTGGFVYASLLVSNQVAAFSVNSATGVLVPVPGSPFRSGAGPGLLAVAQNFLYVTVDGSLTDYRIDPNSGALQLLPGSLFGSGSAALAADLAGRYLYVSTAAGVQGFDVDPNTGALTPGAASLPGTGGLLAVVPLPAPTGN